MKSQLENSHHRPNSAKHNQKKVCVQTLEFEQVPTQKPVKRVQLAAVKPPTRKQGSPEPQQQFDQFMQQKINNNSKLRNIYEASNSSQRIASKPFQLQKQKSSQMEEQSVMSVQTEFTLSSQNSKKPYRNFYKDYKQFDTSAPNKRNLKKLEKTDAVDDTNLNPSFASTEKSYELRSEQQECDAMSLSSSSASKGRPGSQNFKQFVQMKKQESTKQKQEVQVQPQEPQQPIHFRGWTVNEPAPLPSRLQTRQYQSFMENLDQIVENSSNNRRKYLKELDGYIQMMKGGQLQKKEKKPSTSEDQVTLEQQIKRLAKQLKQTETDHFRKQASMTVSSLHSIAEDSIENLSNLTANEIRNRSMFITGILKNRNRVQRRLMHQEEEVGDLNNQELSDAAQTLQDRVEKQYSKVTKQNANQSTLPPEMIKRLEILLGEAQLDNNPFAIEEKEQWDKLHKKLRLHNKQVQEYDCLELYDDLLPKDRFLRQEAIDRIIRSKGAEVNQNLMDLAMKRETVEDKYKIKDLVLKLQQNGCSTQEMFRRYPEMEEQQQQRLARYAELEHQENLAREMIKNFDPKQIIIELGQLKNDMDRALLASRELQKDIHDDPGYQLAETINQKKQQLQLIEIDHNDLKERAERLFELEAIIQNLNVYPEPDMLQDVPREPPTQEEVGKSIEDYDAEFTNTLRKQNPGLFDDEKRAFLQ